ncbi:MAG: glycosyltransferase [Acidobacteriia bacterium]|nr:glycosyltransferase [Terriglobia bacterium]
MIVLWWIFGLLLAWIWLDRLRDGLNLRRVADITHPAWDHFPAADNRQPKTENREPKTENPFSPRVSIIIPARNEALHVEAALHSVLALDYPDFEVFAINDRSHDSTGEIMDRVAAQHSGAPPLHVLHIADLPSGWLGKPHAMWTAAERATGDWLLFTDADVNFRSDCLRRAIAYAEQQRADHLVLFPSYILRSTGEKIMLGGFQLLFIFGHRPWKVDDADSADFIGLGPFNLVRRTAYQAIGTFRALGLEVIEDMKLGKLIKLNRLAQRNVFGPGLLPWSWGSGAFGLVRNLTKNLFALMQFRPAKALGASALWLFLNLMPLTGAIVAPGWARLPYLAALAGLAGIYIGMARRTAVPAWTFLFHPISALLIVYTMLRSMAHTLRYRGVIWRGTRYELEELRKGMV